MTQSRLRLLAMLASLAAVVFVASQWSGRPASTTPVATTDAGARAVAALDAVARLLAGLTDQASTTAALPRLREQSAVLLDIRDVAEASEPSVRKSLATKLAAKLPDLDVRIATALRTPDVEAIAGPVLRQIAERAKALAKG